MSAFRDQLLAVDARTRQAILGQLSDREMAALLYDWTLWARPDQLPPAGEWTTWVLQAGRGAGKTRSGAEWIRSRKEAGFRYFAFVARTPADARDVMIEGESGMLAISPPWDKPRFIESQRSLEWANGAKAIIFSDEVPAALRGPQFDSAWVDEFAKFKHPQETWDMLMFGLRLGTNPQAVVTTTPTASKPFKKLVSSPGTVVTRASLLSNRAHLAPQFVRQVLARYHGTRLGRQEIEGEIVEQSDGALWKRDQLDTLRVMEMPPLEFFRRIVIGVDPSVTALDGSDECGIIAAGLGVDGHGYVLADGSGVMSPESWARVAVSLYREFEADRIVAEVNNGGDMVGLTIRTVDQGAAYESVRASRGKRTRAEPVSALYEQGRVHHVGYLSGLEDEQCTWDPMSNDPRARRSPNRIDALVWALWHLMVKTSDAFLIVMEQENEKRRAEAAAVSVR